MNILLVAPASAGWRHIGRNRVFSGRTFRFSLLSLLTVAAETPAGHGLTIVDEQVDDVPWDADWGLVGISCMTAAAPRAYEIAGRFRERGVPVVLGGMHPTFRPEEALEHADAVVVGEAEGVWPRVVEDVRGGRLRPVYRNESPPSLAGLKPVPRQLLAGRHYATVQAVQATRGCPNRCAFCSVAAANRGVFRTRPVAEVAAEVASLPQRFFLFVDDNLTADTDYARDLFLALRPLGKRWVSQSALTLTDDPGLVRLAADSGCVGLFVGLETMCGTNLRSMEKGFHRVEEYRDRIRLLHAHGIGVEAGLVFGFDHDGPGVFRSTLDALDRLEVDAIQVSVLTPLPGTPLFETMRERIVEPDWSRYDYHHVVFEPRRMGADQLQAGHDWITRRFYSPGRIAGRLARHAFRGRGWPSVLYAAFLDGAYYGRVRSWGIRGYDPARRETAEPASSRSKLVTNPPCSLAKVSAVPRSPNARALGRQRS
jgi:radical SAM superfamily enzyme YgiQ (UPF0313 family)